VQTWLAKRLTNSLSEKLHTRVDVAGVDFEFVKTLVLEDVFVGDRHGDTVVYAHKLKLDIGFFGLSDHWLVIDDLSLVSAKVKLKKYNGEHDMAYTFLLDAFSKPAAKDTIKITGTPWRVTLNTINLTNIEFVYDFKQNTDTGYGMNYRNIRASGVNARFSDIHAHGDTLHANLEYLSLREKSGFILKSMSADVELSSRSAEFKKLRVLTPQSEVNTYLLFTYRDPADLEEFVDSVGLKAVFSPSVVEMADIAYFAGALKGMQKKLNLKGGTVNGKINNLKGKDIDKTYIVFKAKEVNTNKHDLEEMPIPPFDKGTRLRLPDNFAMLGGIHFHGTWEGFFSEFVAYGEFRTAIGSISSDISLRTNSDKKISYSGKLAVKDFNVGRFFSIPGIGKLSMTGDLVGSDISNANSVISLKNGVAQYLQLNDYTYKNIKFDGDFSRKELKGGLSVEDENINLRYNGLIDFKGKKPVFDFSAQVANANLTALHFYNASKPAVLSARLDVNVAGDNIDNLLGTMRFSQIEFIKDKNKVVLPELTIASHENAEGKVIALNSDFVEAAVSGRFTLMDLNVYMRKMLSEYLPAYFNESPDKGKKKKAMTPEDFEFHVVLKNTAMISTLFFPDFTAAKNTRISGSVNSGSGKLKLDASSKVLGIYGRRFNDWSLHADNTKPGELELSMLSSRILFNDSVGIDHFAVYTIEQKDSIRLQIGWQNNTAKQYSGSIVAGVRIGGPRSMTLGIQKAEVFIEDSLWRQNGGNKVSFDSSRIGFENFGFTNKLQTFSLNGVISKDKNDFLDVLIKHLNLANINAVAGGGLNLKGMLDSKTTLSSLYQNPVFTSSSTFSGLMVNNDSIGNGQLESVWDSRKEAIYLHGSFEHALLPEVLFSGYYYPTHETDNLDFQLSVNQLNLSIFKPYVKDYCRNFEGHFSGNLTLKGTLKQPAFFGTITVDGDKITFNYLNTNYTFKGQVITLDEKSFVMSDFVILDEYGNKATVKNGRLEHDHFRNFVLNYPIETNKFMCLNTTEADNPDYYGTAFASGPVLISGTVDNLNIDANVKTERINDKRNNRVKYTNIFIPLENTQEVSKNNFISFVKKDSSKTKTTYKVDMNGLSVNFNLEVTPDANVQMIFDQKVGDVIKAKGSGNIQMQVNTLGKFSMYGDYSIESGEYLFTLKNLINKKFKIDRGGTISWSGDPKDATINLRAVYQVRASLKPVVQTDTSGRRYPVNCIMGLSGNLLQPNINFEIDVPTVDETTQQEVKRTVNNEQEVNRQVLALLVLNNFVPPLGFEAQNSGASAVNTTTSELLSNQLSNWLSQISNDFDLRVKYRPGDLVNREEMELALSTQVLNDRLTVDGSVMSGGNNPRSSNTASVVGDVNVEYKLTKNGKLRMKAYNKTNDNTVLNADAPYSQGLGLAYKEEFNSLDELVKRYREKMKRLFGKAPENDLVPVPKLQK
jgi:hypothetical protein